MSKLGITFGIVKAYLKGWSEWYVNYFVSFLLLCVTVGSFVTYSIFGLSFLFNVLYYIGLVLVAVHVALGFVNIANDYVYEKAVKRLYIELILLVTFRLLLECFI